jgi:hypothetical protein
MAAAVAIVFFIFPLVFGPAVVPPETTHFSSPFSIAVEIANQDMAPMTNLEYSCEVAKLTLANGADIRDANVLVRGAIRKIPGRQAIAARCETGYLVSNPLKELEYQLAVTYRAFPWPQQRRAVYRIAAQFGGDGQLTGWKVN